MKGYTFGRLESKPDYINQYNLDLMIKLAGHINTQALSTLHIPERAKHTQLRNEKGQFLINSDKD